MPVIKQALKKMRRDRKRTKDTMRVRDSVRSVVKSMRRTPSKKALSHAFQILDKAAKKNIIHKNKAARLKSRLAKLLTKK